nr:hypothetical protein [Fodinibius salicampi]
MKRKTSKTFSESDRYFSDDNGYKHNNRNRESTQSSCNAQKNE